MLRPRSTPWLLLLLLACGVAQDANSTIPEKLNPLILPITTIPPPNVLEGWESKTVSFSIVVVVSHDIVYLRFYF